MYKVHHACWSTLQVVSAWCNGSFKWHHPQYRKKHLSIYICGLYPHWKGLAKTRKLGFRDTTLPSPAVPSFHRRRYRGGASQTLRSILFGHLIRYTRNTVVVFLQPPPQGFIYTYMHYFKSKNKISIKNKNYFFFYQQRAFTTYHLSWHHTLGVQQETGQQTHLSGVLHPSHLQLPVWKSVQDK